MVARWLKSGWTNLSITNLSLGIGISLLPVFLAAIPALGAERIYISYGILERSITFESLKAYAQTGELDDDLYVYTRYVTPAQRQQLREVLVARAELSPVAISQFLYSPQGRIVLQRLGQVIQPEARTEGAIAIRGALIQAASDPEGLTPLTVVRNFPTRGIRVDLLKTLQIAGELSSVVRQTEDFSKRVYRQADQEIALVPVAAGLPDLSVRGRFRWTRERLNLVDRDRALQTGLAREPREFPVDLYLPTLPSARSNLPTPVVVISHGLASDLRTFAYLAEHLASHGFVVAVPEHTRSNTAQINALFQGLAKEVAEPTEFLDRPLDVRYLLDELTRRQRSDPRLQSVDLKSVGLLGQSFGGYTGLVLGGAPIDFERLAANCDQTAQVNTLNISLLLQCRAAELKPQSYPLADSRIAAVFAINPVNNVVLGPQSLAQITIPTLMVTGNADTVAPAVPEQALPFSWLTTSDRFLVHLDRGTHFSALGLPRKDDPLPLPPELAGPNPALAQRYMNVLSLAFLRSYVANDPSFRRYLTASYVQTLSQDPLRLDLITQLDLKPLKK